MANRRYLIAGVIAGMVMLLLLAYAALVFWTGAAPWQVHAIVIGLSTLPLASVILTGKSSKLIEAAVGSCIPLMLLAALSWISGWSVAAWLAGGSALLTAFVAWWWCFLLLEEWKLGKAGSEA